MMLWKQWLPSHPFPFSASFRHIIYHIIDCNPVRFLSHSSDRIRPVQCHSSNLAAGHLLGSEKDHLHELILSILLGKPYLKLDRKHLYAASQALVTGCRLSFLHGCSWACYVVNSSAVCTKIKRWFDYTSRSSSQHFIENISNTCCH